jgi:uncharacterized membrane protein
MPYEWVSKPQAAVQELHLWPHQSLQPRGYVWVLALAAGLIAVPLLPLLGSAALWGLLPFLLIAIWGLKFALDRNRKAQQILEVLTLDTSLARLTRRAPDGHEQTFECNRYWVKVSLHRHGGPVPNYVTLSGQGREVEIGAFLSEEERLALYDELQSALRS